MVRQQYSWLCVQQGRANRPVWSPARESSRKLHPRAPVCLGRPCSVGQHHSTTARIRRPWSVASGLAQLPTWARSSGSLHIMACVLPLAVVALSTAEWTTAALALPLLSHAQGCSWSELCVLGAGCWAGVALACLVAGGSRCRRIHRGSDTLWLEHVESF